MKEVDGNYSTVDGIKRRAESLGADEVVDLIERAENRIYEDGDGYLIGYPEQGDGPPSYESEMFFHLGILAGAALEREYPAPSDHGVGDRNPATGTERHTTECDCPACVMTDEQFNDLQAERSRSLNTETDHEVDQ